MRAMELAKFVTRFDDLVGLFTTNLYSKEHHAIVYIVSI